MKTRIIVCVSNRPDLLEKQIELLNNFMIGEKVVSIVYDTRDKQYENCLLYTSPSPRDRQISRMPSSA